MKDWHIKDPRERLEGVRHLVKIRAVTNNVSIAEALAELVEAGARAIETTRQ